jgi:hypothetical protein
VGERKFERVGRSAQRILGTALFLLFAASTVDVANTQEATTVEERRQIWKNKADIMYLDGRVLKLEQVKPSKQATNVPPAPSGQLDGVALQGLQTQLKNLEAQVDALRNAQKVLPAQLKPSETQPDALRPLREGLSMQTKESSKLLIGVELLAVTTLLATGASLFGLLQLRSLRARVRELPGKPQPVEKRVDLVLNVAPLPPEARPEELSGGSSGKEGPLPPTHQKIAKLLDKLREDAPKLAKDFNDHETRNRFLSDFDEVSLTARLDRLKTCSDETELKERWLEPDLMTTLDALARFYSEAVVERRQGHSAAKSLAPKLRVRLYDHFNTACRDEGWFAIDRIDPYKTDYDPQIHRAVDRSGRDVAGAAGKVIAIRAIGRRDPKSGAVIHKAEVIVGR